MTRQKIDSLTSLRFFAAAAIVGSHARGHFGLPANFLAPFELSQGVALFFVLSGFILTYVYPQLSHSGAVKKFWLARFARVWPLHATTMLLFLLMLPEFCHFNGAQTVANLLLLQSWIPVQDWFFSFNSVSWSISTEAFFYLLFPVLISNFEKNWWLKLSLSFGLMLLVMTIANSYHLPVFADSRVSIHGLMYVFPVSRVFEFVLGMTVALLYKKFGERVKTSSALAFLIEVAVLAAVYLLTLNTVKISHWLSRSPAIGEAGRMWLEHAGVPVFAFAALIAVMAWGRGPIARILALRPLVLLGEISFASYLLHRIFLHYYWNHFAPEHGLLPFAIYAAMLLGASYVCWALIEVPCRQAIVQGHASAAGKLQPAAVVVALALLAGAALIWSGAPVKKLANSELEKVALDQIIDTGPGGKVALVTDGQGNLGQAQVGDDLLLLGTHAQGTGDGLKLTLYWRALRDQKLSNFIAVRLLSDNNVLVRLKDYRQSSREDNILAGENFLNDIYIPAAEMKYVKAVAFNISRPFGGSPPVHIVPVAACTAGVQAKTASAPCSSLNLYDGMVAVKLAPDALAQKAVKQFL